jgi:hypothetical protein
MLRCDAALFDCIMVKATQAALPDVTVWRGTFFMFTEYILNLGHGGIIIE